MSLFSDILNKRKNESGNKSPEAGVKTASGTDPIIEALITGFGTLITGLGNINNEQTLKQGAKSKGMPKKENLGLLGLLSKQIDQNEIIIGGLNKYYALINKNQDFLETNILNNEFVDNVKQIPQILTEINNSIKAIGANNGGGGGGTTNISFSGGEEFAKMLESLKKFVITDENKESIEQLALMTKKDGALSTIFENIDRLTDLDVKFDKFDKQLDNMHDSATKTVAIGNDVDKQSIQSAIDTFSEISKVIVSLTGIGILLLVVGLLGKYIDFEAIFKFTGMLAVFLAAIVGVFVLASKYMAPDSPVTKGMDDFIKLVIVAAGILILGALLNSFIPFKEVIMFTLKLGLFLLMLTGVFILWNKFAGDVKTGIQDAVLSVGLAAFIMFLGAACFAALDIKSLISFAVTIGFFLFLLAAVLLAFRFAIGGQTGIEKVLSEVLFLVVGSAFVMFLGAACYKALDLKSLLGFTGMLNLFLWSIIKTLTPLINNVKDIKDGKNVLISLGEFVALSAAVMLIGGGLILAFPKLIITVPMFTELLNHFLKKIIKRINRLIAVNGIFKEGNEIIKELRKFIVYSAATMLIGGGVLLKFPDLIVTIPIFIALLDLMIGSLIYIIKKLVKGDKTGVKSLNSFAINEALSLKEALEAYILLRAISKVIKESAYAFAIIGLTAAIVEKYGGKVAFLEIVTLMNLTILAVAGIMILLNKKISETDAEKAKILLMAISGSLVITSAAFFILGMIYGTVMKAGGMGGFTGLVTLVVLSLVVLGGGILWLAGALGNPVTSGFAYAAIGIILAAAAAFAIVAVSLLAIANTLKILSTIKSFDVTPLISGVMSIYGIVQALVPLALASGIIISASIALGLLTKVLTKMSEAVKDYAELKIAVYDGTKKIGYRNLTRQDFKSAAENVSLIVTTLTKGIMQAYEEHPEWYSISSWTAFWSGGQSPLQKVIRQSKELAPLISKIADAVKDYADLKIKLYDGKEHVGYRHLQRKDFKDAAKNISLVITTLTEGIMMAYEEHPEWYGATLSLSSFTDWLTGNSEQGTPIERVIKQNMKLAPLISKIGEAVEDIANLKFANKWDNNGKAISYKLMKTTDFNKASSNIVRVISTLTQGIMDVYTQHPDWYGVGGHTIKEFLTSAVSNIINDGTPMERVIAHNIKLAKLLSKVSDSIKDYAELKVPIKWNEQGNAVEYRKITDEDFTNAGDNIVKVMTTLSYGLMYVYNNHDKWYNGTGLFGTGDTPMEKVIKTDTKLAKLISNVAASVKDYAELLIPIDWDKQSGKAIKFREMKPEDFTAAGDNIGRVVTAATLGLMGYYTDEKGNIIASSQQKTIQKYLMKDENDEQEEFSRLLENSQKIGTIISSMADSISKYAKMLVPDEWDPKTGTPIHYVRMDKTMMQDAGEGIGKIIRGVADALITAYNGNKAMFGWDESKQEFKDDSPIQHVIDSCVNMGKIISGVADGITKFAEMKIPIEWDNTGKPIKFQKINENVFTDAGTHINDILTALGKTMNTVYNDNKKMFTIPTKKEGGFLGIGESEVPVEKMTPFEKVTAASVQMAQVVGSIAQALQTFADKKAIGKDKNGNDIIVGITDSTLNLAKTSITNTLTTVAKTFNDLATGKDKKIDPKIFTSKSMNIIVEAVGNMMSVVGTMSTSLQNLVMLKVPIKWNENGEAIAYRQMGKGDFDLASTNIQTILCAIGNAFTTIANDPRNSWIINANQNKEQTKKAVGKKFVENTTSSTGSIQGVGAILIGMSTLATILSVISGCIYGYATMRFPIGTDNDGKVQYSNPITDTQMKEAKTHINTVASTLVDAMKMIIENKEVAYLISENGSKALKSTSTAFNTIISSITSIIEGAKDLSDNEAAKSISKVSDNLKNMIAPLTSIINDIGSILMLLFKGNEKYGEHNVYNFMTVGKEMTVQYSFAELMKTYQPMFDATKNNFDSFINSIIKIVASLSNMDKPLNESYMKINSLHRLFETEHYVDKIRSIIDNIKNMLTNTKQISSFDNVFVNKETGIAGFAEGVVNFFSGNESREASNREKAQKEINNIEDRLSTYSNLILTVTDTLKKIYINVSDTRMANYAGFNNSIVGFFHAVSLVKRELSDVTKDQSANITGLILSYSSALNALIDTSAKTSSLVNANFDILTNGIISINESISNINENGLSMFKSQSNQLEKFVNTVNSVKLLNISRLNKFVTSLNQLANKMGNLDRLTEAISNRLSKVLEKLVERLTHAEQTIVKADEIQKRRHELIKKSVKEVSALMKQPMTIEVQAMNGNPGNSGGEPNTPQNTPAPK